VGPDVPTLLTLLGVWWLLVLLVPKRAWRTIPAHLRHLAGARRRELYGPAPRLGRPNWSRALGEAVRLLEAGLPIYLISLLAARRGSRVRSERLRGWEASPAGLIARRLAGSVSGKELASALAALDYWPAAAAALQPEARQYTVPPIAWRLEWEARQRGASSSESTPTASLASNETGRLTRIQSLGRLHLWVGDEDLGPTLIGRHRQAFTWAYLLGREVLGPKARATRDLLADETVPGLDVASRRNTLTNRLSHLRSDDPLQPIGATVVQEGLHVYLDLKGCAWDVQELLDLAGQVDEIGPILKPDMVLRVEETLESHSGEFLPEWTELETVTTQGRSSASDVIAEARRRIEGARGQLFSAVGDSHAARQDLANAIRCYELALEHQPDPYETARKLADVCTRSGKGGYAHQVRLRYGLDQLEEQPRSGA
jgi:hypothetical protein